MNSQSKLTIFSLIEVQCMAAPNSIALVEGLTSRTYEELYTSVLLTSEYLLTLGVNRNRPIMAVGENSISLCTLLLAAANIGVCVVMENARRVYPEIQNIIEHAEPSHIFYLHAGSGDATKHSIASGAQVIKTNQLGEFGLVEQDFSVPKDRFEDDVAVIIYTTGSTGKPKGVMLTHDNLSYIAKMMKRYRAIGASDKIYGVLPFTHVMGCASVLLGGLYGGATIFLIPKFNASECASLILSQGITVLQGAPAMFSKLVEHCNANGINRFASLRFIGAGGAPLDKLLKKDVRRLFGAELQNGYGLTEAASICWTRMHESNDDDSVGRPLEGVEVVFRNLSLNAIPDGEVGELWCKGPNLMRGYFNDAQLTASAFDDDGWFNTNDLGFRGVDGRIFIVGRTKDLIIKSGFNVYPLEIETLLNSHSSILHSAVVGAPMKGNEEIHAFVELVDQGRLTKSEISEFLALNLSPYKRPDLIHILPALPLAANGKVLKSQLLAEHIHH